mmetsp:Transcript_29409/g.65850  ORF Transcript_29409/g.65850 Transcript_29409/m.65850 type:complete len:90 (-) Transcript_29409:1153-1422(-)
MISGSMPPKRKEPGRSSSGGSDGGDATKGASSSVADEANSTRHADVFKRLKTSIGNATKQGICPISCELMVDPVVAQDGNTYERTELET